MLKVASIINFYSNVVRQERKRKAICAGAQNDQEINSVLKTFASLYINCPDVKL